MFTPVEVPVREVKPPRRLGHMGSPLAVTSMLQELRLGRAEGGEERGEMREAEQHKGRDVSKVWMEHSGGLKECG